MLLVETSLLRKIWKVAFLLVLPITLRLKSLESWLGTYFPFYTGWPRKLSLFFFGNNFYKNKETVKIFSPQLLEVYGIILVETNLESIMLYYTFSVINTMFIPCTSTAATQTLTLSTTLLSISCGIRLVPLLMMSSYVCGLFSKTLSFRYPLRK